MFNTFLEGGADAPSPCGIDWAAKQARAVVPFELDADGAPVNPVQPELAAGRGRLRHWGEAVATDAIVFVVAADGNRRLLMVERGDGNGWAVPGGKVDPGETAEAGLVRELAEETRLELPSWLFAMRDGRYVPDPRAGRNAWMVTIPGVCVVHANTLPAVVGSDDARRADWLSANSFADLETEIAARGGRLFASHVDMLREIFNDLSEADSPIDSRRDRVE